jgi:hypothetical protein
MPESRASFLCNGFYPIHADNLMHAGLLFALQIARRRHGPRALCTKLDLDGPLPVDGATFEVVVGTSIGTETCRFTVLIERREARENPLDH